jgi:hypothetical protein
VIFLLVHFRIHLFQRMFTYYVACFCFFNYFVCWKHVSTDRKYYNVNFLDDQSRKIELKYRIRSCESLRFHYNELWGTQKGKDRRPHSAVLRFWVWHSSALQQLVSAEETCKSCLLCHLSCYFILVFTFIHQLVFLLILNSRSSWWKWEDN